MSEPEGFVFRAAMSPQRFSEYLDAPLADPRTWSDWSGAAASDSWEEHKERLLDHAWDQLAGLTARDYWGAVLEGDPPSTTPGAFRTDEPGFVISCLMFSEHLDDAITLAAVARSVERFMGDGDSASLVVRNILFGSPQDQPPTVVLTARPGTSRFLGGDDPGCAELAEGAFSEFEPLFEQMSAAYDAGEDWSPPCDSDKIRAWRP